MGSPKLTVDGVVIHREKGLLLVRRAHQPFQGFWALPGGFVEEGERCEEAVVREVLEETGLKVKVVSLLGVYSDPGRDPRGHTVSVVYLCTITGGHLTPASDAAETAFFADLAEVPLAFDHAKILQDAGFLVREPGSGFTSR